LGNITVAQTFNIDNKDSVIFDLSKAILTSTYIDVPVYIASDDEIVALDLDVKFNLSLVTFDTIINHTNYFNPVYYYNPLDFTLRVTTNSFSKYEKKVRLLSIRFKFITPVDPCSFGMLKSDLLKIRSLLNGYPTCTTDATDAVSHKPLATFTTDKLCAGQKTTFKDASTAGGNPMVNWEWNFGNGKTSILKNDTTTFPTVGTYSVNLFVTTNTGCKDTVTNPIFINPLPIPNFTAVTDCKISSAVFTEKSTIPAGFITNWLWKFGDKDTSNVLNPTHIYAAGGTYTVSLTNVSDMGCAATYSNAILIQSPTANFNTKNGCLGATVLFNDSSTATSGNINSWKWYFGDGATSNINNATHIYTTPGTYTVSLKITTNQNCADSISKTVIIGDRPKVKFGGSILSGCTPLNVVFSDSSSAPIGSSYKWYFGDGTNASTKNTSHSYTSNGTYTVKLVVTSASGCADSTIKTNYINTGDRPVPKFSVTNGCFGATTNFTDSSTISSGSITNWKWRFGDGATSSIQNPSHIYTSMGTYIVTLIVTNNTNCSDSISKTITIGIKPIVKFGGINLSGCNPSNVVFTDSSITSIGSTYFWNFGDGNSAFGKNQTHIYSTSGNYTVKLIVATSSGCIDSLTKNSFVNIKSSPVANFQSFSGCLGSTTVFTDGSTISSGTITNWKWNFGDGNTSTLQNPTHVYSTVGNFMVSLKVTSSLNCSDSIGKTIITGTKPTVKFGVNNNSGCAPLRVNFIDSSITNSGSAYLWTFGDGSTSTSKNPVHVYLKSGTYTVKVVVTGSLGCFDSLVKTNYITVTNYTTAKFTTSNGCVGGTIKFNDSSTTTSGTVNSWQWYFGDGNTSPVKSPSYVYAKSGIYTVGLKIKTNEGCLDSISSTIIIEDKPIVKFDANVLSGCIPLEVKFLDASTTSLGSTYSWNFGNSTTAITKNGINTYLTSGTYSVKHIVTTAVGCKDSLIYTDYITVSDNPITLFSASSKKVKLPDATINFSNLSKFYKTSLWNFGDSTLSTQEHPQYTYEKAGEYNVCLTTINNAGCQSVYCDTINVVNRNTVALPNAFTPNNDGNNDLLLVRGGPMKKMELRVYNQWGNLVFLSASQTEGWDGNYKGEPQPSGAYEYMLQGQTVDNETIKINGVITLVR
jgi:gliding motility-associated-like protein